MTHSIIDDKLLIQSELDSLFINSINASDFIEAKKYALAGANIHQSDDWALRSACCNGTVEDVKFFIDQGADPRLNNDEPFRHAILCGRVETMEFLMQYNVDIHANNNEALHIAAGFCELNAIIFLQKNGVNIIEHQDYILKTSAKHGHLEILQYMVQQNADIHANDNQVLRIACKNNYINIVKYLIIDCNADVSILNEYPIHQNIKLWEQQNKELINSIKNKQLLEKKLSNNINTNQKNKKIKI